MTTDLAEKLKDNVVFSFVTSITFNLQQEWVAGDVPTC